MISDNICDKLSPHLLLEYDRDVNPEATKFISEHERQMILDEKITSLPCIMLVDSPEITEDPDFLAELEKQGYGNVNQEVETDYELYKLYFINNLSLEEKMYEQLDKIYKDMNQAFKITVDFGFIMQI